MYSAVRELKKILTTIGLTSFGRYYSNYAGEVVSNEDPKNLGRVKLKCYQVSRDEVINEWALPKGIAGGAGHGMYLLPNKGDNVWVEFREGDTRFPIWSYGWRSETEQIKDVEINKMQSWVVPNGDRLDFNYDSGFIRLTSNKGLVIELNESGISLGSKNKSSEPGVLGDKNKASQDSIVDLIDNLLTVLDVFAVAQAKVAAVSGILAPLAPLLETLSVSMKALSQSTTLVKEQIDLTKSKKVTLD